MPGSGRFEKGHKTNLGRRHGATFRKKCSDAKRVYWKQRRKQQPRIPDARRAAFKEQARAEKRAQLANAVLPRLRAATAGLEWWSRTELRQRVDLPLLNSFRGNVRKYLRQGLIERRQNVEWRPMKSGQPGSDCPRWVYRWREI